MGTPVFIKTNSLWRYFLSFHVVSLQQIMEKEKLMGSTPTISHGTYCYRNKKWSKIQGYQWLCWAELTLFLVSITKLSLVKEITRNFQWQNQQQKIASGSCIISTLTYVNYPFCCLTPMTYKKGLFLRCPYLPG